MKITMDRIVQHFAYGWWAYVLAAVLGIFCWDMAYNVTKYVPPPEKTISVCIVGDYVSEAVLDFYEEEGAKQFPDMELIEFTNIALDLTGQGDYSGMQKLQIVIATGEGDLYIMPGELVRLFGDMQAFEPMDAHVAQGGILSGLFTEDELTGCRFSTTDVPEEKIYGLSAARMYGMMNQGVDTRALYTTLTSFSQNKENALKMAAWLMEESADKPPAWLEDLEKYVGEEIPENTDIPQMG